MVPTRLCAKDSNARAGAGIQTQCTIIIVDEYANHVNNSVYRDEHQMTLSDLIAFLKACNKLSGFQQRYYLRYCWTAIELLHDSDELLQKRSKCQ